MTRVSPIIQAITTEKSSAEQSKGKYTFLVKRNSNKVEIKNAIKAIYGADVDTVRVAVIHSKSRLVKGRYEWIKRPTYKKAIVTLKGKATIDPSKPGTKPGEAKKAPKKTESKKKVATK